MTTVRELMTMAVDLGIEKMPKVRVKGMSSYSTIDEDGDCFIQIWFWKDRKGTPLKYALRDYVKKDIEGIDDYIGEMSELTVAFQDCNNGGYIFSIQAVQ